MHSDDHFGTLFARHDRQRVVEILCIDRVERDGQLFRAVLALDFTRHDLQSFLVVGLGITRAQVEFRHHRVEVGGDFAGLAHRVGDRPLPAAAFAAEQLDLDPVAGLRAAAGAGDFDIVRHAPVQRLDPAALLKFADELLTGPFQHRDDLPGGAAAVARHILARRQDRHLDLVAVHRLSDKLRRDENVVGMPPRLVGRQRHKSESGRRDREFSFDRIDDPLRLATLHPLRNPVQAFFLFFFHGMVFSS